MAKAIAKEKVKAARSERVQAENEAAAKKTQKTADAIAERNEAKKKKLEAERLKQVDLAEVEEKHSKEKEGSSKKPLLLDGKPGAGSGLKPGDYFAPKSNPGAAARVPDQPLQPESLQSHGLGIIHDKDLANPPYDQGDPHEIDAAPYGSVEGPVNKKAEREKAEKATAKSKQSDPDNPTLGVGARGDATASPHPIGSAPNRQDAAGGSNSGGGPA